MTMGDDTLLHARLVEMQEKCKEIDRREHKDAHALAESHVDWFLAAVRPLLIDNFVHGYKHGFESVSNEKDKP
jgi:DNA transposition AAA+ family ATPase